MLAPLDRHACGLNTDTLLRICSERFEMSPAAVRPSLPAKTLFIAWRTHQPIWATLEKKQGRPTIMEDAPV